jgi:hypothetical protein
MVQDKIDLGFYLAGAYDMITTRWERDGIAAGIFGGLPLLLILYCICCSGSPKKTEEASATQTKVDDIPAKAAADKKKNTKIE